MVAVTMEVTSALETPTAAATSTSASQPPANVPSSSNFEVVSVRQQPPLMSENHEAADSGQGQPHQGLDWGGYSQRHYQGAGQNQERAGSPAGVCRNEYRTCQESQHTTGHDGSHCGAHSHAGDRVDLPAHPQPAHYQDTRAGQPDLASAISPQSKQDRGQNHEDRVTQTGSSQPWQEPQGAVVLLGNNEAGHQRRGCGDDGEGHHG